MMNNFIGIDPGLDGAIAILCGNNVLTYDMPTVSYKIAGNKTRREMNIGAFASIVRKVEAETFLEALNGRPDRGATEFRIGENYGMLKASLVLTGTPYSMVSPQKWKNYYGLKKTKGMTTSEFKELSRELAIQIFPDHEKMFARKKDSDRAEAALIANYGRELSRLKSK